MKLCPWCGEEKALASFSLDRSRDDGHYFICKACYNARYGGARAAARNKQWRQRNPLAAKSHYYKHRYGLTLEDFQRMTEARGGRCDICSGRPELLHVDHDHNTGAVRGLLCQPCNTALGKFGDTPELLHRAIAYLNGALV